MENREWDALKNVNKIHDKIVELLQKMWVSFIKMCEQDIKKCVDKIHA